MNFITINCHDNTGELVCERVSRARGIPAIVSILLVSDITKMAHGLLVLLLVVIALCQRRGGIYQLLSLGRWH
jgi:hypothetical protein